MSSFIPTGYTRNTGIGLTFEANSANLEVQYHHLLLYRATIRGTGIVVAADHNGYTLTGQFLLTDSAGGSPQDNWCSDRIGQWVLWRDPALPARRLATAEGTPVGWLIGYAITENAFLLDETDLKLAEKDVTNEDRLENFIYSFGGRYAVAIVGLGVTRFYLDPCGSLSAVYCPHQRLVASTPNLIPRDVNTGDRVSLAKAIGIPLTDGMYPLGLTPRYGVERILPNHLLELSTWQMARHWPRQAIAEPINVNDAVNEISAIIKRNISAIVAHGPTRLQLTAGRDSRMLLACARNHVNSIEFITAQVGDAASQLDCDIASEIAQYFDLNHSILPKEEPIQYDLDEWMFRIGHSTGEVRGLSCATAYKKIKNPQCALLKGSAAAIAKASFWLDDDTETTVISPERIAAVCRCSPYEEVLARARDWLKAVPVTDSLQLLDILYIEQRVGCWNGVWPYADCEAGFNIFPLCHRGVIERMLRLPTAYRRSGRLMQDIIAREWPELLHWPFNRATGASSWFNRMQRLKDKALLALTHPAWALQRSLDTLLERPQWQRRRSPALRRS